MTRRGALMGTMGLNGVGLGLPDHPGRRGRGPCCPRVAHCCATTGPRGSIVGFGSVTGVTHARNHPRLVSPAPRAVWDEALCGDPAALETQSPAWTDAMCGAAMGFTDASRAYEMDRRHGGWSCRSCGAPSGPCGSPRAPTRCTAGSAGSWHRTGRARTRSPPSCAISPAGRVLVRTFWPQPLHADRVGRRRRPTAPSSSTRRAHLLDLRAGLGRAVGQGIQRADADAVCVPPNDAASRSRAAPRGNSCPSSTACWSWRPPAGRGCSTSRGGSPWRGCGGRDPLKKFQGRRALPRRRGSACRVRHGGRAAGGGAGRAPGPATPTTSAARWTRPCATAAPTTCCTARAIEDACAAGCGAYCMGDSGWSPSAAAFKERFGARPVHYREYRFERLPLSRTDARGPTAPR